ncbi:MAG: hypothetical protein ABWY11_21900 [Umezawaea sp.]
MQFRLHIEPAYERGDCYPEIRTACLEGFHDMSRLLELAARA